MAGRLRPTNHKRDMISVEEAELAIARECERLPREDISLTRAAGFALAEALVSPEDVPPFHRAMMDGYAVRAQDVQPAPARLRVLAEQPAGADHPVTVGPGEAVKIMTGAPVPTGADAVQVAEVCRETASGEVDVLEPVLRGKNIAPAGSECRAGEKLFEAGHVLKPSDIGILATLGWAAAPIVRGPNMVLANTGSELVDSGAPIKGGQIRNSNQHTIASFLRTNGFFCRAVGTIPDSLGAIGSVIRSNEACDAIILTGGVSVGDYDLVEEAARGVGFEIVFSRVAIKPGKPLVFGKKGRTLLFGLSGNPVSSLVQAARFLVPALRRIAGYARPENAFVRAELAADLSHKPGRASHRPARLSSRDGRLFVTPVADKGSADLFAWRWADCLTVQPPGTAHLSKGTPVDVMLLPGAAPLSFGER